MAVPHLTTTSCSQDTMSIGNTYSIYVYIILLGILVFLQLVFEETVGLASAKSHIDDHLCTPEKQTILQM